MTMLDWSQFSAVERSADKMRGAWVFRGTRVPVKSLFENLRTAQPSMTFSSDLLDAAEAQFDAFVTTDQNLCYQQNLAGWRLAIPASSIGLDVFPLSGDFIPVLLEVLLDRF
jgi:hypothetical protein